MPLGRAGIAKSRCSPFTVPSTNLIRPSRTRSSRTAKGLCIERPKQFKSRIQCPAMRNIGKVAAAALLLFFVAASLLALPQVPISHQDEAPNFYFTRLAYQQNPYGGRRGR